MTTARPTRSRRARPSIDELISRYLSEVVPKGSARSRAEGALDLLRSGLNGYGHQHLGRADGARWSAAFNDEGDEEAFCRLFGATYIVKYLDEFLGYFLIRKVIMPEDQVHETVEVVRAFVAWLGETGEITPTAARRALGRVAGASVDLPAAERLGNLLYDLAPRFDAPRAQSEVEFDEVVDDFLVIERVAPGRLWFLDGVGPIKVPEAASAVARPGWTVNLVLGRRGSTWEVLEVGNVYPETLA
jgi:hypothetical protein